MQCLSICCRAKSDPDDFAASHKVVRATPPPAARRKDGGLLWRPGATSGDEPHESAEAPLAGRIRTDNAAVF